MFVDCWPSFLFFFLNYDFMLFVLGVLFVFWGGFLFVFSLFVVVWEGGRLEWFSIDFCCILFAFGVKKKGNHNKQA